MKKLAFITAVMMVFLCVVGCSPQGITTNENEQRDDIVKSEPLFLKTNETTWEELKEKLGQPHTQNKANALTTHTYDYMLEDGDRLTVDFLTADSSGSLSKTDKLADYYLWNVSAEWQELQLKERNVVENRFGEPDWIGEQFGASYVCYYEGEEKDGWIPVMRLYYGENDVCSAEQHVFMKAEECP